MGHPMKLPPHLSNLPSENRLLLQPNGRTAGTEFSSKRYEGAGAVNDILRTGLAEVYEDYAAAALAQGDYFQHGLWMRAADLARSFVPRGE